MEEEAVDCREFDRYKREFNIEVDEAAPHFPQWIKVFLLMMREAETEAALAAESLPFPPRLYDCCIICSGDEEDFKHAERFKGVLSTNGFIACVLQESQLGPGGVQDKVQEMLDGSYVVFLLCTPSLMQDSGIAKMAFQDQLQTHIKPGTGRGKKIVPVILPKDLNKPRSTAFCGSSDSGARNLLMPMGSSSSFDQYEGVSKRKVPFGITLFSPITLQEPDIYMQQVRRCISLEEQKRVRTSLELKAERKSLFQSTERKTRQQKAIVEAQKLFKSEGSLLQLERCMRKGKNPMQPGDTLDLRTDGAGPSSWGSTLNGSFARGPGGFEGLGVAAAFLQQPHVQVVNISHCSNISVGTSYHVIETTAL